MGMIDVALPIAERLPWPDTVSQAGISYLVGRTARRLSREAAGANAAFARGMSNYPIAEHTQDANTQHYEVPAAFFALALGPRRKYSSCFYDTTASTLAEAEVSALRQTAEHAGLADGQDILELGCGWGSLSLWMAELYPSARITAVSNSNSQRASIESEAATRGLRNLRIVTADMNVFETQDKFDRVVSVEMFEHMANWQALFERVRSWLKRDGRLFLHIFTHRSAPYRFDLNDKSDWIAQHFFTGGIMPSHGLVREFPDQFAVEATWRWNGKHYERTAMDWLANFDRNVEEIDRVLRDVYDDDAALWRRRWRLFFLATAGLFGHRDGEEWGVSHYRLAPA